MVRRLFALAPIVAVLAVSAALAGGQRRDDHPKLRAALHELREARKTIESAKDAWPPGYKDRALRSTQDAINSVKVILAVKDVDNFRGVDRDPDFYNRFGGNHPRLRAALEDLREARTELRDAKANFGQLKQRAMDDIDVAIGDILTLIRYDKR